jgi:hypothetical protein
MGKCLADFAAGATRSLSMRSSRMLTSPDGLESGAYWKSIDQGYSGHQNTANDPFFPVVWERWLSRGQSMDYESHEKEQEECVGLGE